MVRKSLILIPLLGTLLCTTLPSYANETGKKNTAIGAGAGAAVLFITHHKTAGVLGAGAAAWAYSQYQREHQHNKRVQSYRRGYQQGRREAESSRRTSGASSH